MKVHVLLCLSILVILTLSSESKNVKNASDKAKKSELVSKNEEKVKKTDKNGNKALENLLKHCSDPIKSHCQSSSKNKENNYIEMTVCIESNLNGLDTECQVAFFNYRFQLYTDNSVLDALETNCGEDLAIRCEGKKEAERTECLFIADDGSVDYQEKCHSYTRQLGQVLFSDYKVLADIHKVCDSDMDKNGCKVGLGNLGMFGSPVERIVQCLMHNTKTLSQKCHDKFLTGDQGSKDDKDSMEAGVHEECKFDLKKLCTPHGLSAEESYSCLLSHIGQVSSPSCQDAVLEREGFSFRTLGVSLEFYLHCNGDIGKRKCSVKGSEEGELTRLTRVLMCLEKKDAKRLSDSCDSEVSNLKERFMGQYELDLEFAKACEIDREEYCSESEDIVECLKKELKENKDVDSKKCSKQLKLLSTGTGGGDHHDDIRNNGDNVQVLVDPAPKLHFQKISNAKQAKRELYQFCSRELDELCSNVGGKDHKGTLFCLSEHLSEHNMSPECHEHVGRIKFFQARPLASDSSLFKKCESELSNLCKIDASSGEESERAPALACLFSHFAAAERTDDAFASNCQNEVNHFLHSASRVNGMDQKLFSSCIPEMGEFCPPPAGHSSEFQCLKEHQERIESHSQCIEMLEHFNSREEGLSPQDENVFMHCHNAIQKLCKNKRPHELMGCLKESSSKNLLDSECKRVLKDSKDTDTETKWQYSPHLNVNCKNDLVGNCPGATTNNQAIECLSTLYKAGTLTIKCKSYLENVLGQDIQENEYDEDEVPNMEQSLTDSDSQESLLKKGCKKEIDMLCSTAHPEKYLECLIDFKMDSHMSQTCQVTIISEEIDFVVSKHMDTGVVPACAMEIKDYCPEESSTERLACLQEVAKTEGLGAECVLEMQTLDNTLRELQLDKSLAVKCHSDAYNLCHDTFPSSQSLVSCLSEHMKNLESGSENKECISEVVVLIGQAQLDIHKDPDLAEKCKTELNEKCDRVRLGHTGHGEKIKCLFKYQEKGGKISSSCSKALNDRLELWSSLSKKYPNIQRGLEIILDKSMLILKKKVYPNITRIFQGLFLFALSVGVIVLCILCRATKRVRRKIL